MENLPTVVVLPGLNGTKGLLQELANQAPTKSDVLLVEYPRHDKKSYPELAKLVRERLNALDGPYVLVGESFSGPVAVSVASQKPSGLVGVILVASFITPPNIRLLRLLPWQLGFRLATPLYFVKALLSSAQNRQFVKATADEIEKVSPGVLADRIKGTSNNWFRSLALRAIQAQDKIYRQAGCLAKILTQWLDCSQSPDGRDLANVIAALIHLKRQPAFPARIALH